MTSDQHPSGPLHGVRVVELGGIGPGPFAGMMFADLGAEVVRIDRPGNDGPRLAALERGRRSVVLDLRRPEGVAAALQLTDRADVLIEGFRPGVTERLGLGPEDCWQRNPKLVYGRMTGWGQEGPWAQTAGHDIAYIAVTGTLHAIGRADGPPQVPLNVVGDFGGGGMYLVAGVLAALLEANRSGRGQVVDAAIVDGAASLMTAMYGMFGSGAWRDERGRNLLDTGTPFYDVYETADGGHMAVGALEPKFYAEFVSLLGLDPEDADRDDPTGWPALRERIAAAFKSRTRDEWAAVFDGSDACVAPVLSMTEAPSHPQVAARGTFAEVDGTTVPVPAPRFSRTQGAVSRPPAASGEHTRATLTDWGVSDVDALIESGVAVDRSGRE
ncbi:MAG: CoA transferase [Pseudonocardiaceae bacterium]|nr:CoA transferase [Pseudonocardiaceae bacterium]